MSTAFHRSMRSLDTDRFHGSLLGLLSAAALLVAWLAWFLLARVALCEISDTARLELDALRTVPSEESSNWWRISRRQPLDGSSLDRQPDCAWTASPDPQCHERDDMTGERVMALPVHPNGVGATRVAFSPDGPHLAAASDTPDPLVIVWDTASGQQLYSLTGLPNRAWALAFSPDGSRLATGFGAGFVKVYDAATGEESLSLPHHGGRILSVAFSPDGTLLATGGLDPPTLWDLATGQVLGTFPGNTAMVNGLAFSPDGTRLASSSLDGTTRVYTLDVDELVTLAHSRLTRWFTLAECQQYLHPDECPPEP
jgi:WD40 repeat protein